MDFSQMLQILQGMQGQASVQPTAPVMSPSTTPVLAAPPGDLPQGGETPTDTATAAKGKKKKPAKSTAQKQADFADLSQSMKQTPITGNVGGQFNPIPAIDMLQMPAMGISPEAIQLLLALLGQRRMV